MSLLTHTAKIIAVDCVAKTVILDESPFYPQGGGQASDKGTLTIGPQTVEVSSVKKDPSTGNVLHYLSTVDDSFLNSQVDCSVDPLTRDLNSRCHSAGHLLDHAAEDLKLPLEVKSAYHFLAGPYVEYGFTDDSIDLSPQYIKFIQEKFEKAANEIVKEAIPVTVYNGKISELSSWRQNLLPEPVKQSGLVRLVRFEKEGYEPVPCSGTHVTNSALIQPIVVKKISLNKEKRTIRVSYTIKQ